MAKKENKGRDIMIEEAIMVVASVEGAAGLRPRHSATRMASLCPK